MVNSTIQDVATKDGIGYSTIQTILNRRVTKKVDCSRYRDLNILDIDEIVLRKGYKDHVTIISTKPLSGKLTVLAVIKDRKQEDIKTFFEPYLNLH